MPNASNIFATAFLGKLLVETKRFIETNSERHSNRYPTSAMLSLGESGNVYVSLDFKLLDGHLVKTFTIASLELAPHLRGKQIFTRWLASLRDPRWYDRFNYVAIECVLNDRFAKALRARGAIDISLGEQEKTLSPTLLLPVIKPN